MFDIYKITNLVNNKVYIGITTHGLQYRYGVYRSQVKSQKLTTHRVVLAMKKYGFENFKFETIEEVKSQEELIKREIYWISYHHSTNPSVGYNVSLGGYLPSQETRLKMSNSQKRKKLTEDHKIKIARSLTGIKHTEERIKKRAIVHKLGYATGKIKSWNKGSKGVMKLNSGTFGQGRGAPNKGRKRIVDENGKMRFILINKDAIG